MRLLGARFCQRKIEMSGWQSLSRRTWLSATNSPSCAARSNALIFAGGIVSSGPGFPGSGRTGDRTSSSSSRTLSSAGTVRTSGSTGAGGAPRIHGELLKLGIEVSQATVSKYMVRHRKPPSQSWRAFLNNHVKDLVSIDLFTVPTVTFNVTESPGAKWTAQQIVEAFPWDSAPRYLLRDRDGIYGYEFTSRVKNMGIKEVKTAARSPWQNPYVERMIGTLRRDCLDHVIVLNDKHLRRILRDYLTYYHGSRTHLSLDKDSPEPRKVELPDQGQIVEFPMVGGLHHRYSRRAA